MRVYSKYFWLFGLFLLLALIRLFENELFYDPYLIFFHSDYLYMDSPRREVFKLSAFTSFRYFLNSSVSIAILYVFFKDISIVKFSVLVYIFSYVVLLGLFLFFVLDPKKENYYIFFNIRRFLIQPIMLLLLLPAFYYYRKGA